MSSISFQNRQRIGNFLQKIQVLLVVAIVFLFFMSSANADQTGTNYNIPFDVNNAGGADVSKSNVYLLSDSLGEPIVGYGSTNNYVLNSGYRQPSASDFLSLSCSSIANLGSVVGTGQKTGSGTCTVYTDAYDGYRLVWQAGSNNRGGLVGHWKLDETSGTTAYDSSGLGNNGTLTNGPAISTGTPSKFFSTRSVSFDGVDDYLTTPDTGASNGTGVYHFDDSENFTLSAWYKGSDTSTNSDWGKVLMGRDSADIWANLVLRNGKVEFIHYNAGWLHNLVSTTTVTDGAWHHIAYINRLDKTGSIYIDGKHEVTGSSAFDDATRRFVISGFMKGYSGVFTSGSLDDIRVYNTALSGDAIRDLASLAPPGSLTASGSQTRYIPGIFFPSTGGLIGHWKMEETIAGSTVTDSSGYNRDGTPNGTGGANNLPQPATSVPGNTSFLTTRSLNLDGTDDYVNFGTSADLSPANMSFSFWTINNVTPAQYDALLLRSSSTAWADGWGVWYDSASTIKFYVGNYATNFASATISPQQWNHVAGTWDGTTLKIYVNGVLGTNGSKSGAQTATTQALATRGFSDAFNINGLMDDLRMYSRALSPEEIKALYSEPQAWSVAATESAWGGRLSSDSTDDDAKWGTDGGSEKWINIGDGSYTVVRRQSATPLSGSVQYMDFRGEVGSSKVQTSGVYTGVVTFTAVGY